MTTKNKRVAAYLPDSVHDSFLRFKEERGIDSDSEALKQILAEYFGIESEVATTTIEQLVEEKLQPYLEELRALQAKVDGFVEQLEQPVQTTIPAMSDFFKAAHEKHYAGRKKG